MDIKTILASVTASVAAVAVTVPPMVNFVQRQAASPGVAEPGHSNITGNSIAARFGAGQTPAAARVQVLDTGSLVGVRSVTNTGTAVLGNCSATTGAGTGGAFFSNGTTGIGVSGEVKHLTGANVGGFFKTRSSGGMGGQFLNSSNNNEVQLATSTTTLLTKGKLPRHEYVAGTPSAMVPIAYGFINADGTVSTGSGNFTSTYNAGITRYDITITGESFFFSNYITIVTPVSGSDKMTGTSSGGGLLLVKFFDDSGTQIQSDFGFGFAVFKPSPAANLVSPPNHRYADDTEWAKKDRAGYAAYLRRLQEAASQQTQVRP